MHTIKENKLGGELNSTERGRFARIRVEVNLGKKLIPKIKIRNRIYRVEYEGLNLICFDCGKYGQHRDQCPLHNILTQTKPFERIAPVTYMILILETSNRLTAKLLTRRKFLGIG